MDLEYFIGALVVRRGQSGARAALVQEDSNRWAYRSMCWVCYLPGKVRVAENIGL